MNITTEGVRVKISGTVRPADAFIIEEELRAAAKGNEGRPVEVDCSDANILANGMFIDMLRRVELDVRLPGVSKRLSVSRIALVNPPLQLQDALERLGLFAAFEMVSSGTGEKMTGLPGVPLTEAKRRIAQAVLIGGKLPGGLR